MLTTTSEAPVPAPAIERAAILRAETAPIHERLDQRIMELRPFEDLARYAAFVRGQYALQRRMEPMYRDARLAALVPDLAERSRLAAIAQDLADLGQPHAVQAVESGSEDAYSVGEALGWLYVSEGSTLGAAFLLKEAQKLDLGTEFGARHLAAHAEGRGLHWRRFSERLNAAALSLDEEEDVVPGARAAFEFVRDAFEAEFARV